MYPKFIEVHDVDVVGDSQGIINFSLNVANISGFNRYVDDHDKAVIAMTDGNLHVTAESYDEIKQLITDCGCLIRKPDPRLDMSHPLALDDLQSMIGEPVWNSNLDRWELVTMVTDFFCKTCHTGQYAGEYSEDDLIKTPLYRMRQ